MTRTELLKIAQKHLGQGGARFRKFAGLPAGAAWCNAFVDYVANEGGVSSLFFNGKKETYCPHSIKWCKANLAEVPPFLALPMDIIYFDWDKNGNPNHIGLVRKRRSTSDIYTIEGNTDKRDKNGKLIASNIVVQKTRSVKYVQGIYRTHFIPSKELKKAKLDESNTEFGYMTIYNLQCALGMKPNGILTKETVKFLQKRAGTTQDGFWSTGTSKAVQKMVGVTPDGAFGAKSVCALKKWVNRINYPVTAKKPAAAKPSPQAAASKPKPTTAPAKKGYTGTFPTLNTNAKIVNGMAYRMCYPYGTPQKKYTFKDGKPKPEYKAGIDKVYPNHKSWPNKRQKVGACCDVFTGVELGLVGIHVPKDLKNQLVEMPKMTKQLKSNGHYLAKDFKAGDVVQRGRKDKSGHTWVVCEVLKYDKEKKKFVGVKYVANAHYKHLHGCYAVMDAKPKNIVKSKWKYYECYTVLGACRTWYGRGDYGWDVLYIQQFLKWAGFYFGNPSGDYTEGTEKAVSNFQKAVGLKVSGRVGKMTIEKMRAFKK